VRCDVRDKMANNTAANDGLERFGCTAKELKELMETRGVDAVNRLKYKYGTVDDLCKRLHVSPNEGKSILRHSSFSQSTNAYSALGGCFSALMRYIS